MKICIPVETSNGLLSKAFGHFGSAPYFFIYDSNENKHEMVDNANSHHEHGSCNPLGALENRGINIVICQSIGKGAFQKITHGGIKVYLCEESTAEEIIKKYSEGALKEVTLQSACGGHSCH
jgi:predicted Fe-Mo cluster-binding NifX family protein